MIRNRKVNAMYTFYQYPPCSTCKRAKAELDQLGVTYEAIDIKQTPPSKEDLLRWIQTEDFPLKSYFNTSGQVYRQMHLKEILPTMTPEKAAELLSQNGMLIKRPLLIKKGQLLQIGHRKAYADLFAEEG